MFRCSFLLLIFFSCAANADAQAIANMIITGQDWRMCGTYDERDTLEFKKYEVDAPIQDCNGKIITQLLTYSGNKVRFLNWNKGQCFINEPGMIEVNDGTGEIRFYFDDGSSRDFLLLFINNKKMVIIDKNY